MADEIGMDEVVGQDVTANESARVNKTVDVRKPDIDDAKSAEPARNEKSIFEFFEKNTAVLVTCCSAIVAAMSYLLNMVAYVKESRRLDYWNISSEYVWVNVNQLYALTAMVVYVVTIWWFDQKILNHANSFFRREEDIRRLFRRNADRLEESVKQKAELTKQNRKNYKAAKKMLRHISKEDIERIGKIKTIIARSRNIDEQLSALANSAKEIKKSIRNLKWINIALFICKTFANGALLVCATVGALLAASPGTRVVEIVFVSIAITVGSTALIWLLKLFEFWITVYKNEKEYNEDNESSLRLIESSLSGGDKRKRKEFLFSNKKIIQTARAIGFHVFITVVIFVLVAGNPKNQHEFSVVCLDEIDYIVAYQTDDTVFLLEATIDGNHVIVDTKKQRTLVSNDLSTRILEFMYVCVDECEQPEIHRREYAPVYSAKCFDNNNEGKVV